MSSKKHPIDEESALLELCSDGARAAADALARFLDAEALPVEPAVVIAVRDLESLVGKHVAAIGFRLSGGFEGALVHVLGAADADAMLARVPGGTPTGGASGARGRGALSEIGNIAASAFLNAVATRVRRACLPSVPRFSAGGVRLALESVDVTAEDKTAVLVISRVKFTGVPEVSLTLVVVPEPVSVASAL